MYCDRLLSLRVYIGVMESVSLNLDDAFTARVSLKRFSEYAFETRQKLESIQERFQ